VGALANAFENGTKLKDAQVAYLKQNGTDRLSAIYHDKLGFDERHDNRYDQCLSMRWVGSLRE
jgi:hypothetical protein